MPTIRPDQVEVDNPNQSDDLLQQIDTILELLRKETTTPGEQTFEFHQRMIGQFGDFSERYPTLFQLMCRNPFDFERGRLVQMLQMRNQIYRKEISFDQASKKVGRQYYNEFVKPSIPENERPSEQDLDKVMSNNNPDEQRRRIQQMMRTPGNPNAGSSSYNIVEK